MRARNIKPGFFKSEEVAECSPWARLLFPGLWCMADREGRLEDRPKRMKGEIFPYDSIEIEPLLQELVEQGLIIRYEVDGQKLIWIPTFVKHQKPHPNEKPSILAAYEASITKVISTSNQGDKYLQPRCNSIGLNPSSLNPDLLNPESLSTESPTKVEPEPTAPPPPAAAPPPEKNSHCPVQEIISLYNQQLPQLTRSQGTATVVRQIKDRWKQDKARQSIDWWRDYFSQVAQRAFLLGQNDRGWKADLVWLTKPGNMDKVLEGNYLQPGRASPGVPDNVPEELRGFSPVAQSQAMKTMAALEKLKLKQEAENG